MKFLSLRSPNSILLQINKNSPYKFIILSFRIHSSLILIFYHMTIIYQIELLIILLIIYINSLSFVNKFINQYSCPHKCNLKVHLNQTNKDK